jgi:HSP20 family molecular chaperone IbpA
MATISVRRLGQIDDAARRLLEEIDTLEDRIRRRAYYVGQGRGAAEGSPVDDWLRAEREVCWVPRAELRETGLAIHLTIGVSAVADKTIEVTLLPEMVILRGAREVENDSQYRKPLSEFAPRVLFRRIALPSHIHAESSVVRLEGGVLKLSAAKVDPA